MDFLIFNYNKIFTVSLNGGSHCATTYSIQLILQFYLLQYCAAFLVNFFSSKLKSGVSDSLVKFILRRFVSNVRL